MTREFLVAYQEVKSLTVAEAAAVGAPVKNGDAKAPFGALIFEMVQAPGNRGEAEQFVRNIFAQRHIHELKQLRIVLAPNQNVFNKEEAAEYLRCSVDQIDTYAAKGMLPKARDGYPKYTRRMLDKVIAELMQAPVEEAA
jgi:hypothetical protein